MIIRRKVGTARIASANPDTARKTHAIISTTQLLTDENIDISRIQETHNERTDTRAGRNRVIFRGGADKTEDAHKSHAISLTKRG